MPQHLIGIDLGTSYSSLSCLDDKFEARPIANKEGEYKTPSVVYFAKDGGGMVVGTSAIAPGYSRPERFVSHSKRFMGSPVVHWEIDGVFYSPTDISALILGKLIRDAEKELGKITEAVVTVPAHFSAHQRQQTIQAGEQAGLKKVHLLNEPVAAALSFALGSGGKEMLYLHDNCTVLIYDLGGGTFDLSLVRFDQTQLRVLATSGELLLGGLDWDQRLIDRFVKTFQIMHGVDLSTARHSKSLRRLGQELESAKRRLSDPALETTELLFQHAGKEAEYQINRAEFELETTDLVERTYILTEDILKAAGLTWKEVDSIIPVGGSTRMPMIGRLIERLSNRGPSIEVLSPDIAVSMGAALYAGILGGRDTGGLILDYAQGTALSGFQTEMVLGRTLGILVRNDNNQLESHPLIRRDTPLPAHAQVAVTTIQLGQSIVRLKIVEGEGRDYDENVIVCICELRDLPPNLPEGSLFDVEVSYDTQGLLQVIAKHRKSGRLASISTVHQIPA